MRRHFQGPIPHPDTLQQYELIHPGSAEIIIGMAAKEQAHRHQMSNKALRAETREATMGQVFAFLLGTIVVLSGTYAAVNGHPVFGGLLGGGGLASLLSVFIIGRRRGK
ncbi:DUF2335 domain-containing protein [Alkalilimnicola ehrlichii]